MKSQSIDLFIILIIVINITFIPCTNSGKIPSVGGDNLGLYDDNDKVISLYGNDINTRIVGQKYATLLEFYNSFCGHCKRFAPTYKELAKELMPWRNLLKIMAIDCAADENNDACREYEIMAYPTLRYFSPYYEKESKKLGESLFSQDRESIKKMLAEFMMNETNFPKDGSWPDFSSLSNVNKESLFLMSNSNNNNLPDREKQHDLEEQRPNEKENLEYIFIIYEPENSTLGAEMILDFNTIKSIKIYRTISKEVASSYDINSYNEISIIDKNLNIEKLSVPDLRDKSVHEIIENYLRRKNIQLATKSYGDENENIENKNNSDNSNKEENFENNLLIKQKIDFHILNEVKRNKHTVYQSDLENAIRYSIFHEFIQFPTIDGERLLALQRFMKAVKRYSPLGEKGNLFLKDLEEYVVNHSGEIKGTDLKAKLKELHSRYEPIFSASRWIGCAPSKPQLRGYSCGLWQLFHFMSVQAAENENSSDPLEVLQAMHGFIKYFFGCTDCSNHFQAMAAKNRIWSITTKDDAILWLWSAHNEVNRRLAGDETEDPEFPKIQFPTRDSCQECYKDETTSSHVLHEINWDKNEVLKFMKKIHNPENVSRFGVDNDNVLPPTAKQLQEKRQLGNIFSDMDMRVGIFLYVFCIAMMIIAVKLFLYKGYKKKVYSHDFLGAMS